MARKVARAERGAALLILMVILVLGVSWMLASALSSWLNPAATNPSRNGKVLGQAKAALLGYVAKEVMDISGPTPEQNPGRLPCPEALGNVGTPNEGVAAGNCTLPAVGRLPWRTLGLDKLVDASGEPLWYVVSPGWAIQSGNLQINFNTVGQIALQNAQGVAIASNFVALIVAPGPPLNVQASPNCAAINQTRALSTLPPPSNWYQNYLECQNATYPASNTFATAGPSGSFNDQVLQITADDVMRAIEGPIAQRIQTQIVPAINSVYTSGNGWTTSQALYPFAAPFNSPTPESGTNVGSVGNLEGVLPIAPIAAAGGSGWSNLSYNIVGTVGINFCLFATTTRITCYVFSSGLLPPTLQVTAYASNIGTGLRQAPGLVSKISGSSFLAASVQNALMSNGSARVDYQITVPPSLPFSPTWMVNIDLNAADNSIADPTDPTTGWFIRNGWYKFTQYALSQGFAPGSGGSCGPNPTPPLCLTITNSTAPNNDKRAVLVFAGRALGVNAPTRPSGQLTSYFEGNNSTPGDSIFEKRSTSSSSFNDRVFPIAP